MLKFALSLFVAAALGLAGPVAVAPAAEPRLDRSVVFQAAQGGYESYRIPCLVVTAKGTLLAFCEARRGSKGDWGAIDLLLRRSTDRGAARDGPAVGPRLGLRRYLRSALARRHRRPA